MNHFYLIRHGETSWNQLKKLQGHTDIDLNEAGVDQAEMVAKRLAHLPLDYVYSSDLLRAKRTAQAIAKFHQSCSISETEALRERCYGTWEGLHWDEVQKLRPGSGLSPEVCGEYGIETFEDMQHRAVTQLLKLHTTYPAKHIAIVTHGGFINSLLHLISNGESGTGKTKIANTSFTHISYKEETWKIHILNDAAHIPNVESPSSKSQ